MQRVADCLVTGATGFLGRWVVSLLLRKGVSVRCLVRRTTDFDFSTRSSDAVPSRLEVVHGDLLSPTDMDRAVDGAQVVYHLAAESRGLPATIFSTTVVGSKNLLQAILRVRPERVVLVSSLNVYGLTNADPTNVVTEDYAVEEHPGKRDAYSHSKIWQERLFRDYLDGSGIELTVVRPGYIYGTSRSELPARLGLSLGNVLMQLKRHAPLPITYVENCADAVIFCARTKEAASETYNIVDDDVPTGSQYLELSSALSASLRVLPSPFFAICALCYLNSIAHKCSAGQIPLVLTKYKAACSWRGHRFSNQKLRNLGWRQPVPSREALERAFAQPILTDESAEMPLRMSHESFLRGRSAHAQ
jgi:nucleoside-diphosphate-sugar epimerase